MTPTPPSQLSQANIQYSALLHPRVGDGAMAARVLPSPLGYTAG